VSGDVRRRSAPGCGRRAGAPIVEKRASAQHHDQTAMAQRRLGDLAQQMAGAHSTTMSAPAPSSESGNTGTGLAKPAIAVSARTLSRARNCGKH
jgi:hypothetical protein